MNSEASKNTAKTKLYVIVGVLVLASLAFRWMNKYHFETTSILFVGLPAFITVLMIKYGNTPKTAYGIVFKVITLFLLMSLDYLLNLVQIIKPHS